MELLDLMWKVFKEKWVVGAARVELVDSESAPNKVKVLWVWGRASQKHIKGILYRLRQGWFVYCDRCHKKNKGGLTYAVFYLCESIATVEANVVVLCERCWGRICASLGKNVIT